MKKIIITTSWDDGHILDIKLANLLKKYGIKGTFYISPEDREIPADKRLNKEQILKLSEDFEIGAHTMTHPNLEKIDDGVARKEMVESKKYLEQITGREVSSFCYPSGYYNERHKVIVKEAGFTLARTVERFRTDIGDDYFALPTTMHTYRHWSDIFSIFKHSSYPKTPFCNPSLCHSRSLLSFPWKRESSLSVSEEMDPRVHEDDRQRHGNDRKDRWNDRKKNGNDRENTDDKKSINKYGIKNFFKQYLNWDELAISLFDKIISQADLDSLSAPATPEKTHSCDGGQGHENDRKGGVFHLWGHSWEIEKNNDWKRLERVLKHISGRKDVVYAENRELASVTLCHPSVCHSLEKGNPETPLCHPREGGDPELKRLDSRFHGNDRKKYEDDRKDRGNDKKKNGNDR